MPTSVLCSKNMQRPRHVIETTWRTPKIILLTVCLSCPARPAFEAFYHYMLWHDRQLAQLGV